MRYALLLAIFSLPAMCQVGTNAPTNQSALREKFKAYESKAPKGYPTLFVVAGASMTPGTVFGNDGGCGMNLETFGQIYYVTTGPGFLGGCKAYEPGTVVWGHVHRLLGTVVDLVNTDEPKLKSHRYIVQNVTLVNPATQQ